MFRGSFHPKNRTYHNKHHHNHTKKGSRVRAIHNVAKGPDVNILLDGKIALSDVGYKAISDYLKVPSGNHRVTITTVDGKTTLASVDVDLIPGKDYTVVAHGDVSDLSTIALLPLQDDNSCPMKGKSHVRFVHAASKVPAVDIWVNMNTIVFNNVTYGNTGKPTYVIVDSGSLNLAVTPSGSTDIVLGPIDLKLDSNKTYTIVATGLLDDEDSPLSVLVSEDNACSTIHTFF